MIDKDRLFLIKHIIIIAHFKLSVNEMFLKKNKKLQVCFGIIGPIKNIINGYIIVVGKFYKQIISGFALTIFVSAYGVLICVQVKSNFLLREFTAFTQFL